MRKRDELTEKTIKLNLLWEACKKDINTFTSIIAHDMVDYKEEAGKFYLDIKDDMLESVKNNIKNNLFNMIDFNLTTNKETSKFLIIPKNELTRDILRNMYQYDEHGTRI